MGSSPQLLLLSPKSDNVEIMYVTVENQTDTVQKFTAYGAIPVYGRSADNIRDHRNVTSMLHRIETTEHGINVCPTMSFDERGHQPNHKIYYVNGCSGKGKKIPISLLSDCRSILSEKVVPIHIHAQYMKDIKEFPHTVWQQERKQWVLSVSHLSHWLPVKKQTLFYYQVLPTVKKKLKYFEKYHTSDKVKMHWKKPEFTGKTG